MIIRCPHCGNDNGTLIEDTLNGFWLCSVCAKVWSKVRSSIVNSAMRGMKL